jgi:hypothetical protein
MLMSQAPAVAARRARLRHITPSTLSNHNKEFIDDRQHAELNSERSPDR